jgi:hypothetical protein
MNSLAKNEKNTSIGEIFVVKKQNFFLSKKLQDPNNNYKQ